MTDTTDLTDFLLARIAEDEAVARAVVDLDYAVDMGGNRLDERWYVGRLKFSSADGAARSEHDEPATKLFARPNPARVLAECEAKRRIVELHKSWPVLVETEPTFDPADPTDVAGMTFRMSKQIAWSTEQQYRERFGTEPPTGPIIRALAAVYADHPDYREEWRL